MATQSQILCPATPVQTILFPLELKYSHCQVHKLDINFDNLIFQVQKESNCHLIWWIGLKIKGLD